MCYSTTIINYGPWNVNIAIKNLFLEEERIAEALTRYYGVKEILLPPRKLEERIPSSLMEFYNSLISEMAYALSAEAIKGRSAITLNDDDKSLNVEHKNRIRRRRKSSSTSRLFVQQSPTRRRSKMDLQKDFNVDKGKRKKTVLSELDFPREPPILPTSNPEELHNLLFCYIEILHKDPSFHEKMKDPVKDLYNNLETKSTAEFDPLQPAKKVCIIFHGAPFTEYQETACRSAKVLQVPLLCIDNVIIEGIALGDNWISIKLRQIVDDAYQEYLLAFEKHKDALKTKLSAAKKTDTEITEHDHDTRKKSKQSNSPKITKLDSETTTKIEEHSESEASLQESIIPFEMEFAKIPREQDLKFLDPISLYECKIQTILLIQRIFQHYTTIESKINEKNQDTFLGIEIDLLSKILRERLSSSEFTSGFVLQTLNNIFFKSCITTLLKLLDIIGYVEYSLFVTFMNSMDIYTRKMKKLQDLKTRKLADEVAKKIQEIDEMSLSEYELLAEDDKEFYLEATLPIKKQEALQRKMQFIQQMTALKNRNVLTLINVY
ncbi:hypothetical protein P5V15_013645 [Pogonomyrmex californicus]